MEQQPDFDIAIVGMGPAGATLARLLKKEYRVAVIDRKSYNYHDEGFRKPCGGLLAPDAQKALSQFNLTLPKEILVTPQIFAVKTVDIPAKITKLYQRFYLNLDRHKFDLWLASLLPASVAVFDQSFCTAINRTSAGFNITFEQKGKEQAITAKRLVGADGANSIVRRRFFNRRIRQYVAIQQWFREEHAEPFYSSIFDETLTDCYAWSDSKDGYFILGAALPKVHAKARFEELKVKLQSFGFKFGAPIKTEACLVSRPANPTQFAVAKNGVFLIGEAAGFISPSSLEGISYAMDSALQLSKALNASLAGAEKMYRRKTLKIRLKLCSKLLKNPFMYIPFLRRLVMHSGLMAVKRKS